MENKVLEKLEAYVLNTPEEVIKKHFPPKEIKPNSWVSIEDDLPMFRAVDILQGFSIYKVKDLNGNEFETYVADQNTWKHFAMESGITHWFNR